MIVEQQITTEDLGEILSDILFSGYLFVLKSYNKILEDCNLVDFNKKNGTITIVYSDRNRPVMTLISIADITYVQFDFTYSYQGGKASRFVVSTGVEVI